MSIARYTQAGLLVWSLAAPLAASAQPAGDAPQPESSGITIQAARSALKDEVHYMSATIDYDFSAEVLEALHEGVALTVVLDIEIFRERGWMWDEEVARLEQRYQIAYHALTRQYMVRNLNIGTQHNLPTARSALVVLGTVVELPLIDDNLLEEDQQYRARLQARLDTDVLPVPLRLLALVSPEWRLASEWHEWPL